MDARAETSDRKRDVCKALSQLCTIPVRKKARLLCPGAGEVNQVGNYTSLPKKFMFYDRGVWNDFPVETVACLCEAYRAGKGWVEVFLKSCMYLVSFVQMLQTNVQTGYQRSIAWVDEDGKLRCPAQPFEGPGCDKLASVSRASSESTAADARNGHLQSLSKKKGCVVERIASSGAQETSSSNSSSITIAACFAAVGNIARDRPANHAADGQGEVVDQDQQQGGGNKLKKLESSDAKFAAVRKLFLDGLGMFSVGAQVTGVYEVAYEGASGQACVEAFENWTESTEKARGEANVREAWYGSSREKLLSIVQHGFGQPKLDCNYGVGVYLAPRQYSRLSAVGADVDDKGEQHLLFCRVILGKSEVVRAGSMQFHPTNEQFDTGVDDLLNPKRFIVWSTHMNTHILPVHVISFKLPPEWHEIMEVSAVNGKSSNSSKENPQKMKVQSTNPKLFSLLKSELPASAMSLLQQHYFEFKSGKISREELLKRVRAVAGEKKLKRIQEQVLQSSWLCGLYLCQNQIRLLQMQASKRTANIGRMPSA